MPLPLDIVLVRHGESEGNVASRHSRAGDHSLFTDDFKKRHSSSYRLTDKGIKQAKAAGQWIKKNFKRPYFDRYLTSEYTRAMETAGYLDLPEANWQIDFFLREREWGDLDAMSHGERDLLYSDYMKKREAEPFYWIPPNGESFASLCSNRIKWVLDTLAREYPDKRAMIVCHGEVMWAFRILIERIRQNDFIKYYQSDEPFCRMVNCQIIHYSRKDPKTGKISNYINWMRTIDPAGKEFETDWQWTSGRRYSSKDLLGMVKKNKRMIS